MRILQVIDKLSVGGAERVCIDLSNLLLANNVDISVLTFTNHDELEWQLNDNISIVKYERKSKFNFFSAIEISKILNNYDIIHVHMRHVYRYIKLISLIFRIKAKIVFHDHYGSIEIDKSVPFLFNSILKPKYYIGVSKELVSWGNNALKVKNTFLLSNIIVKKSFVLNQLTTKKGIVIVGNIKPVKNQLFAIKLAAKLNENLTIIGKIHDKDYYQKLKLEIKELGVNDNVNFIFNSENVQELLPEFKFGLMTSFSESGPLVLIEYIAQNLPFLSANTGDVSQLLTHEFPDFFLNDFDLDKWIESVKKVNTFDEDFESIYYKYFSPKDYINKCINIYQKIKNF